MPSSFELLTAVRHCSTVSKKWKLNSFMKLNMHHVAHEYNTKVSNKISHNLFPTLWNIASFEHTILKFYVYISTDQSSSCVKCILFEIFVWSASDYVKNNHTHRFDLVIIKSHSCIEYPKWKLETELDQGLYLGECQLLFICMSDWLIWF